MDLAFSIQNRLKCNFDIQMCVATRFDYILFFSRLLWFLLLAGPESAST